MDRKEKLNSPGSLNTLETISFYAINSETLRFNTKSLTDLFKTNGFKIVITIFFLKQAQQNIDIEDKSMLENKNLKFTFISY